jgi:3-deoxy-D-manno-octulosonic-acid transferase
MMRLLYNLLFPFAFLFLLPNYLLRMFRRGGFRQDFGQRFAVYSEENKKAWTHGEWFWIHAVSVGELLVALKIIGELHRRHPAWKFVVSSTTSTAHALALSQNKEWLIPIYTPVDFPFVVRHAFNAVRPRAIILTESEMWPNFVWTAKRRNIPMVLLNARVSPRSERRYRRFARVIRSITRHLEAVGLQEPEHAGLWTSLGVDRTRLHLTGSVKYDPVAASPTNRDFREVLRECSFNETDPILLAGSTHDGEELILAEALKIIRQKHPKVRLLIAPRHIERCPRLREQLAGAGFRVGLRTQPTEAPNPDILLINTTGELRDWYACADLVFVGKSLCGSGGQNPVEPILAGCPVLFGPHMENFASLAKALRETGGAREVQDAESLAEVSGQLLDNYAERENIIRQARAVLHPHQGATARSADLVEAAINKE